MGQLDAFTFVSDASEFIDSGARVARVDGRVCTAQQLFDLLYRLLALPGYFGFNWTALSDCVRDFHWIDERDVVVVHDELPGLPSWEVKTYLEVLSDAALGWKPGEAHSLKIVFNDKDRPRIEATMMRARTPSDRAPASGRISRRWGKSRA